MPKYVKTDVVACYSGKCVSMDYIPEAKRRFSFACMRITDNNADGYVLDGDKVYRVVRSKRSARLLAGEERDAALAEVAGYQR